MKKPVPILGHHVLDKYTGNIWALGVLPWENQLPCLTPCPRQIYIKYLGLGCAPMGETAPMLRQHMQETVCIGKFGPWVCSHGRTSSYERTSSHGRTSSYETTSSHGRTSFHGRTSSHVRTSFHGRTSSYVSTSSHGRTSSLGRTSSHVSTNSHGRTSSDVRASSHGRNSSHA
jgi:hypothetical protein